MSNQPDVLILVLMEDTLRVETWVKKEDTATCLNPCFNGRYSQSQIVALAVMKIK